MSMFIKPTMLAGTIKRTRLRTEGTPAARARFLCRSPSAAEETAPRLVKPSRSLLLEPACLFSKTRVGPLVAVVAANAEACLSGQLSCRATNARTDTQHARAAWQLDDREQGTRRPFRSSVSPGHPRRGGAAIAVCCCCCCLLQAAASSNTLRVLL